MAYEINEKKLYKPFSNDIDKPQIIFFLKRILAEESSFFWLITIYGIAVSILSLSVPMAVQFLINSIAFTALIQPIIVLTAIIFVLLSIYGVLNILQFWVSENFKRRFFARISCDVGLTLLHAENKVFEEANQVEMVNRFFESVTIQKKIPKFFTKTFATILQTIVGLILISFYHPLFLVFSFFMIISICLIWKFFYKKAVVASFYESRRKYDLAGWLEDIAGKNKSFKSEQGLNYGKFKINFITGQYLKERKKHFRNLFSQIILLFGLYAIAASLVLMIGGYLILKQQLTIGQLVAAELVMSVIFYGVTNLGLEFEEFYDLIAACEKLSQFKNIPLEKNGSVRIAEKINCITLDNATYHYFNNDYKFNLTFEYSKNYLIRSKGFSTQKVLIDLINGFSTCEQGAVFFNEIDIKSLDRYSLRDKIYVIDNSPLIEGTLKEYLTFNNKNISSKDIEDVVNKIGLKKAINRNEEKIETRVLPSGWPFSESEKIMLKFARALLHNPQIIIITEIFDMIDPKIRKNILHHLNSDDQKTIIYFSHLEHHQILFDQYLFVDKVESKKFDKIEQLEDFEKNYLNQIK
jgi:putative ABC transport system ATP-binding protein